MSSNMRLAPLTKEQAVQALEWREEQRDTLRTPYFLTTEMQERFYEDVVCDRNSRHRFYAVMHKDLFVGMAGLVNIEWENSTAEISIISPKEQEEMVELLLDEAFNRLNLHSVYGEAYFVSEENLPTDRIEKYKAYTAWLPDRKYINGNYYSSLWWLITRSMYENCR